MTKFTQSRVAVTTLNASGAPTGRVVTKPVYEVNGQLVVNCRGSLKVITATSGEAGTVQRDSKPVAHIDRDQFGPFGTRAAVEALGGKLHVPAGDAKPKASKATKSKPAPAQSEAQPSLQDIVSLIMSDTNSSADDKAAALKALMA